MYDRFPMIDVPGCEAWAGHAAVLEAVRRALPAQGRRTLIIDCYPGVDQEELRRELIAPLAPALVIHADELTLPREQIEAMIRPNLTDDRVFGAMSYAKLADYFDEAALQEARRQVAACSGLTVVYGVGASLVTEEGLLLWAEVCRWEIQLRYRKGMPNWLCGNAEEDPLRKIKRGYFWEWRIADRHKQQRYDRIGLYLDMNIPGSPRLIAGDTLRMALADIARRPFRTAPYFDPGVWGGQWMKAVCGLDPAAKNYAWSFDGVPEENALILNVGGVQVQTPSVNLVFTHPEELLGEKVYARFGAEFPIRFDFLDTMGGQNLSLQVHPRTAFAAQQFGIHYTQDESYYILDAREDANPVVFLGLKENIDPAAMMEDLRAAQRGEKPFPDERYINRFPARKHDHFLIPAGTVHCSGANTMVLEISATPYIFTFKLWDWGRLGLDGLPRPTHIDFGEKNIAWQRDTAWVRDNLVGQVEPIAEGDGWREERTGLHELEFIETRRHWFTKTVPHCTHGSVNVLNLVEGDAAVVQSPEGAFAPFTVHYAETFIIPACVGSYTISPVGAGTDKPLATIKAFVRT